MTNQSRQAGKRLRSMVRGFMALLAILAIAWASFFGIAHLFVYHVNAYKPRTTDDPAMRASFERDYERDIAWNRQSPVFVATLSSFLAVAGLSIGLKRMLRSKKSSVDSPRSKAIVFACSTVTRTIVAGVVLAVIGYGVGILLVMFSDD
ncbi:hypothetical protein [Aquisphaera insulae]|uniref:hypothetical protein n=1 Tax=Aquisphaera insulae TaxID=2712864 RepID=UPI0013EA9850|nr:hypothetical protein [Aquisphaera insulae]